MFLLASTLIDTVLSKFDSLPIEFKGLLWAAYMAGKSQPKFAADEMLLVQKIVGKLVVEWLCDIVSSPRHYLPEFTCQGLAIRRQMAFAESLLRAVVEVLLPFSPPACLVIECLLSACSSAPVVVHVVFERFSRPTFRSDARHVSQSSSQ